MLRPAPQNIGAMRVGGVQAGVIHDASERFAAHEALSTDLAAANLDLVVWAESSVGFDLDTHPEYADRLQVLVARLGAPLLVNVDARRSDGRGIAKAAVLIGPSGVAARYDKMRLVPFGEYIPLRRALGWIASVSDAAAENRQAGNALAVIEIGERAVGPMICFESAFPDLARELAHQGADVVVVQTATTTFQGSWAQPQHASLAAVRAVESGRSVVHAAVSGVTAAFGPTGERLLWVEDGVVGTWVVTVPVAEASTVYVLLGDWLPRLAMVILIAAFLGSRLEAGRRRPETGDNGSFVALDADEDRPSESGEKQRCGAREAP
jgi:apolipoprotein N-acyltransferase